MVGNGSVRSPGGFGSGVGFGVGGLTLDGVMYTGGSTIGNGSIRSHGGIDPGSDLGGFSIGLTIGCGSTRTPGDVTIGVLFRTDRTSCTRFSCSPPFSLVGSGSGLGGGGVLGGGAGVPWCTIGCGSPSFLVGIRPTLNFTSFRSLGGGAGVPCT